MHNSIYLRAVSVQQIDQLIDHIYVQFAHAKIVACTKWSEISVYTIIIYSKTETKVGVIVYTNEQDW